MTDPACQRWIDDPDANRAHLSGCEDCRKRASRLERLDRDLAATMPEASGSIAALVADRLPVAPWEGARHRAWALAGIVLAAAFLIAAAGFFLVGIPPIEGFRETARGLLRAREVGFVVTSSLGELLRNAPRAFHVAVAVAFVVVNALLLLLLRRGPRGYDVDPR